MDRSFKDIFRMFELSLADVKSVKLWIDKGWVRMSRIEPGVCEDTVIETPVISPTLPWTANPGLEVGNIQDVQVSADPVTGIEIAKGQDFALRRLTEDALARTFAAALRLLPGLFGEDTLRERSSFAVNLLVGEKPATMSMNRPNTECKVLVHRHGVVCFELVIPPRTENGGLCEALMELSQDPTLAIIKPGSGTMRPDCTTIKSQVANAGFLLLDMVATRIVEDTDLPFEAIAQDHGRDAQDSCTVFFEKAGRTKAAVIPRIVSESESYAVEREIFGFEEEGTVYFKGHMLERSCERNWRVEQHDTFVVTRPTHGGMPKVVVTIRQGQDKWSGQWNLQAGHSFSVFFLTCRFRLGGKYVWKVPRPFTEDQRKHLRSKDLGQVWLGVVAGNQQEDGQDFQVWCQHVEQTFVQALPTKGPLKPGIKQLGRGRCPVRKCVQPKQGVRQARQGDFKRFGSNKWSNRSGGCSLSADFLRREGMPQSPFVCSGRRLWKPKGLGPIS